MLLAAASAPARAAESPHPREFAGAVHVHTRLSHDSRGTFDEIAAAARRAGLAFVMLADHPGGGAPEGQPDGMHGGVLFIPGLEIGHLLALGVRRVPVGAGLEDLVRDVHAQQGLALVSHPEGFDAWGTPGLDGTEIYNLHADVVDEFLPLTVPRWLWRARRDPFAAMLVFFDYPAGALARWDARAAAGWFSGVAANDAHQNVRIGRWTLDPYERQFRFVRTVVTAPRLDRHAVLDGLRAGRAVVVFGVLGDPGPVRTSRSQGRARLALSPGRRVLMRLLRDGREVWRGAGGPGSVALSRPAVGPGAWRFEVWTRAGGRLRPWVLTNHLQP